MRQNFFIAALLLLIVALSYQCKETRKLKEALAEKCPEVKEKADTCRPSVSGPCADTLAAMDNDIAAADAQEMISRFWQNNGFVESECPAYDSLINIPFGETFNRDEVFDLLQRSNIAGLRVLYGVDSANNLRLILAGVKGDCTLDLGKLLEKGQTTRDTTRVVAAAPVGP